MHARNIEIQWIRNPKNPNLGFPQASAYSQFLYLGQGFEASVPHQLLHIVLQLKLNEITPTEIFAQHLTLTAKQHLMVMKVVGGCGDDDDGML